MAIAFEGSVSGSATNGGTVTLTIPSSAAVANNTVIVVHTINSTRTFTSTTWTVTSSTGINYTEIQTPVGQTGWIKFNVGRRIMTSTGEVTLTVLGSGQLTDTTAGLALIFSGVSTSTPEDTTPTSTIGLTANPDSPSITTVTANAGVVIYGSIGNSTILTAPTSFLNLVRTNVNDTNPVAAAMAWITIASTGAFNPAAFTGGLTSTGWVSGTLALRPDAGLIWQDLIDFPENHRLFGGREMVGY